MKKKLKFRAELLPDMQKVKLTLLEQSHFGTKFGIIGSSTFEHDNFSLTSLNWYLDSNWILGNVLFVPDILTEEEHTEAMVSIEDYEKIKKAVIAYNAHDF